MPAYSRILLPWDSQPQEAVGVDWDNPLTQGLCALYNPAAGLVNLVTGSAVTKSGNIEATVSSGKAWIMSATTNIVSDVVPALERGPDKSLGFFMVGPIATTAGNASSRIFHYGDSLFGAGYFVTGGTSGRTDAAIGTGSVINVTGAVACFDGNANTRYGHNWRNGVGWEAYRGGALLESAAAVQNRATPTTSNLWLLNRDTANRPIGIGSGFTLFGAWNRALTAEEHKSLSDNPWQLFAPRSIWVPVSVGGGSASSITAAAGVATASTLTASSTAASTPTAAAGAATASTVAASSTAASAIASATGAATASTLTGSAVVAGAITAAAGVGTGGTLVGDTLAAGSAAIVAAGGVATAATLGGSSVAASDIGVAAGVATAAVMGGPGAEPAARLFAGGFPRREQFRKGYIIKGERYWLTEEELAVMVAQMLAEISRGDIKQVTAGKPKTISKKTWDAIQVEARIEAVAKQFDDTDEDEDESILMML